MAYRVVVRQIARHEDAEPPYDAELSHHRIEEEVPRE